VSSYAAGVGDREDENRFQPATVFEGLLEISAGDRLVWTRQFQQRVSYPADTGYRCLAEDDDPHLRGRQSGGRPDFLSGGVSFRRVGQEEYPVCLLVIFLVVYLGFALTQNIFLVAVLFIFYGLYQGMFRAVGKALASDFVPEHLRASGVGWYSTTVGLLQLVVSIVAGLLWDMIGHTAVFYCGAVFAGVGGMALILLIPGRPDRRSRQ
jgi:hypothetical protein